MYGKGATDGNKLVNHALTCIQEAMENDGMEDAYLNVVAPSRRTVTFAKALNRTITGSINEFVKYSQFFLAEDVDLSPCDVGCRLNDTLMSAIAWAGSHDYGKPLQAMKKVLEERS